MRRRRLQRHSVKMRRDEVGESAAPAKIKTKSRKAKPGFRRPCRLDPDCATLCPEVIPMPAPAPVKKNTEALSRQERIRQRAYELYIERGAANPVRTSMTGSGDSRVSRARYTSPMPPAPIGSTIS
jgi:hypothetical protein